MRHQTVDRGAVSAGARRVAVRLRRHVHPARHAPGCLHDDGPEPAGGDDTVTIWLGTDRVAMVGGSTDAIVRLDQSKIYLLDHEAKVYHVLTLPIDLAKLFDPSDPNAQQLQQMMEMMKSTATVTADRGAQDRSARGTRGSITR